MTRSKLWAVLRLAALPVVAAIALLVAWRLGYFQLDKRQQLVAAVNSLEALPQTRITFLAAYAVGVALLLPVTIMALLAGALFGAWKGAGFAWTGALLSTVVTHLLARHVARAPMRKIFGDHRMLRHLREQSGVLGLLRLRILPVAPFAVLDYVSGVAGVPLPRVLLATAIGVIPNAVVYSYVGAQVLQGMVNGSNASRKALVIAGSVTLAMLLISLLPRLLKRPRA